MLRAGKGLRGQGRKQFECCCGTESGVQEDGHIPGHVQVPGMAAKLGLFTSCRKKFKSYCKVKEGLFREETHSRERVQTILKAKRGTG